MVSPSSSRSSASPHGNKNNFPGDTTNNDIQNQDGMDQGMKNKNKNAGTEEEPEFSESDVVTAFKFLDIDRNNFLGAEEIRHILICMGEIITEEEIDTMVRMVDKDGDGQVSYTEFCNLMLNTNTEQKDTTDHLSVEVVAAGHKNDIEQRESKRLLLLELIREKEIGPEELKFYSQKMRQFSSTSSLLNFEQWLGLLNIEPTGQYRKLFQLYAATNEAPLKEEKDSSSVEYIDMKEFLLGTAQYLSGVEVDWRIGFVFDLYDTDRSGLLCRKELIEVLKANHMQNTKAVLKKAQTIMSQVNNGGKGTLNIDEFRRIASKFPNLLWGTQGAAATI